MKIRKGDIVGRKSYNKDIIFVVDKILKTANNTSFAILKGITVRIEADSPIEDLELINKELVSNSIKEVQDSLEKRIQRYNKYRGETGFYNGLMYTGKILHLDGDRRYSEKSNRYYRKLGLNATVKNIAENKQSQLVIPLLNRYKPDILVVTGHDAMLKNGRNYNTIYNYRNSRHFINTVKEARKWGATSDKLVIFARRVSKFF